MCKGDNISIIPFSNFAAENFTTHISQSTFKSSLPAVENKKNGGGGRILFTVYQKLSTEKTFYAILILILHLNLEILKRLFVNFCKSVFKSQNQKELEL